MNSNNHLPTPPPSDDWPRNPLDWFRGMAQAWNRFWFTPTDPTLWCWIRIGVGMLAVYTIFAFGQDFSDYFGTESWYPLENRLRMIRDNPAAAEGFHWPRPSEPPPMRSTKEEKYVKDYLEKWKDYPPLPFPDTAEEAEAINAYRAYWGLDPRSLVARGTYNWSLYLHVTDPTTMLTIHALIQVCTILFMLGLGTRFFSVLTWAGYLQYVQRTPIGLFGFDVMMVILLTYLMLVPCGARYSLDAWLRRWWRRHRPVVVWRWKRFWARLNRQPYPDAQPPLDETPLPPVPPSLAANFVLRLLQIHVCIVYGSAGFAKLKGGAWWNGTAMWLTLGCPEFTPMYFPPYLWLLKQIASNRLVYELVVFSGTYFTLFFEIGYPFLIWRRGMRWVMLVMAVLMHGFIAIVMGLKTFALVMIIMNMAFLPPNMVPWLESVGRRWFSRTPLPDAAPEPEPAATRVPALQTSDGSEHVQRRG